MSAQTAYIDLSPAEVILKNGIYQGNTFLQEYTLKDKATGTPVDLTGATAKMRLIKKADNSTIVDLPGASGTITFPAPATNGNVRIEIPDTVTATWPIGCDIIGDLELTIGGVVRTYVSYSLFVKKPVTPA